MPKVSVIIPNYNHALFLEQRIQSVLKQSYQDYELILMDDSSSDNSISVLNRYKGHPKVSQIIINKENSGNTFKQWNKGVKEAVGEFIWLAESDDYADPDFLSKMVANIELEKGRGLVFCQSILVNEHGEEVGIGSELLSQGARKDWENSFVLESLQEKIKEFIQFNIIINASAVLFRKEAFIAVGGADTSYRLAGDWLLWLKISIVYDIMFYKEPLNYFRCHSNNVRSKTKKLIFLESGEIMNNILSIEGIGILNKKEAQQRLIDFWTISMYNFESKYLLRNVVLTLNALKIKPILVFKTLKDVSLSVVRKR